jgi:hypothetical protein
MSEELTITYMRLDEVARWPRNVKKHDIGALVESIRRYGMIDPPKFDATLGALVYGNGRDEALEWMHAQGDEPPRGVKVDTDGMWLIPIKVGIDAATVEEAEASALDHNNLTLSGGDFTAWDMSKLWGEGYTDVLAGLATADALPITVDGDALDGLLNREANDILKSAPADVEEPPDDSAADDIDDLLAPFPWFGGKARVAGRIWARLGVVDNYVEPFCGSAAVLLACPHDIPTRTVNDADGFIANFWRAVEQAPDEVARYADWPVNESDLFARHVWLVRQSGELARRLDTDPDYYDAKVAGWWVWGCCAWIGTGWCSGDGPWNVDGDAVINIRNGNAGRGVNRQLPHLGNAGRGVNRKLPHLGNAGRGVNRQLPHLGNAGRGVNRQLPHLGNAGRGECLLWADHIRDYMQRLSDKLRRVRVCCGDWARVVTPSVTERHGLTGIVLDPPYGEGAQQYSAGGNADKGIAAAVWEWAIENGDNPQLRIAVCGYDDGREMPTGWSLLRWMARKGYQATDTATANPSRECVWFSPHCLPRERAE